MLFMLAVSTVTSGKVCQMAKEVAYPPLTVVGTTWIADLVRIPFLA